MIACDSCLDQMRERDGRETDDGGRVCPDCANDMVECEGCERLFDPTSDHQTLCADCQDEDDDDDDDGDPGPDLDMLIAKEAEWVVEHVAQGEFYALPRAGRPAKDAHMPYLRAQVKADLAAMTDAELMDWLRQGYGAAPCLTWQERCSAYSCPAKSASVACVCSMQPYAAP
jgi:hypothetical protein